MDSSLTVIDVARVTPSNSDSSESLTLPLTFFDLQWVKLRPFERVIFYRLGDATRLLFDSVIIPNLRSSLSFCLSYYLPLAGKLVWNSLDQKPSVIYSQNDAVSFTIAETNADFSRLTGNKPFPSTELQQFVPELLSSDESASVVSFQVTLFANKGFCIGLTGHHAVLDGTTINMFLKAWAYTCKQQSANPSLPQDLILSYDRTVIKSPANHDTEVLNGMNSLAKKLTGGKEPENPKSLKLMWSPQIGSDIIRFTLNLSRENIETLRERIKRESPKELRLSRSVISFSYALTCSIRARGGDPKRTVGYLIAVDCRGRFNPPIPSNYFGNCVSGSFRMPLTAETFMGEEGFLAAARLFSDSVEELDESVAWKIPDVLEALVRMPPGAQVLSTAGSVRFGVYGLDFGWGRPEKVMIASISEGGAISIEENRDQNGGVEVGFSLKKDQMEILIDLLHQGLQN